MSKPANYLEDLTAQIELDHTDGVVTITCYGCGASVDLSEVDSLHLEDVRTILSTMNRLKKAYKAAEAIYHSEYGD